MIYILAYTKNQQLISLKLLPLRHSVRMLRMKRLFSRLANLNSMKKESFMKMAPLKNLMQLSLVLVTDAISLCLMKISLRILNMILIRRKNQSYCMIIPLILRLRMLPLWVSLIWYFIPCLNCKQDGLHYSSQERFNTHLKNILKKRLKLKGNLD